MASLPFSFPHKRSQEPPLELGSPHCSDPDCEYCKELRAAQEKMRRIAQSILRFRCGGAVELVQKIPIQRFRESSGV